jgi:MFS family permease
MVPFERRGIYQAIQNILVGFGAVSGASLGGLIADLIGWRWCFLLQVPFSLLAFAVGYWALENPQAELTVTGVKINFRKALTRVDVAGSVLLVAALLVQLLGLSLGGNELPWTHPCVIGLLAGSIGLLLVFAAVEASTSVDPVVPLRILRGRLPVFVQITNVFAGMAAYAVREALCD